MSTEQDVASGLIDWLNSLELGDEVQNVGQLNDGTVLWKLLQKIDKISFPGDLPEDASIGDEWVHKWTNLKHVYDALTIFLVEECGQRLPLFHTEGRTRPDLKAIAQHSSLPDTILLLKLCVIAAINCAERVDFLTKMQELGEQTQQVLVGTAQEADQSEGTDIEDDPADEDVTIMDNNSIGGHPMSGVVELDLASEERLGKVIADNQRIALEKREVQKQLDDLYLRYEKLEEQNHRAQEELGEANDRLTAVLAGKGDALQGKPDAKSESIIASLEARVIQTEAENEELRKTNEVSKVKADRVQKLQDDFDEIKIERDRLSRKANTAEKYRQKLESIQDIEKDNHNLKLKVQELQTQIRQSDSSQASTSNLQREIDEYRRLLPSIEQERYDLNEMKKRLEFDYHALEARWHDLSEEYQRSQNQVEELRGRLQDYEDGIAPSTPTKNEPTNTRTLEAEEADFAEAEARLTEALLSTYSNTDGKESEEQSGISEDELRAIMSAMRAQAQAGSATERESGVRAQKKLLIAIDRQRTKNMTLTDHVKKQSELIQELKTKGQQIDNHDENPDSKPVEVIQPPPVTKAIAEPTAAEKAAAEIPATLHESKLIELLRVNENLKREIKLMTSAWYEQNQRLAASGSAGSGAVSLMRSKMGRGGGGGGLDEPRSFLGRQRRLVDAVVLGDMNKAAG